MRLADMLLREDFYEILKNTTEAYFRQVLGKEALFSYEKHAGCEKLIVNGKLSFISQVPAPAGLRQFLLAEYNVRGSKLKYVIGKAAARIIGTWPQIGKLRTAYITRDVLGKDVFINPQNRSIRFFDYRSMTVDCIIKSGFTDKYFANQLRFRRQYSYDFMLPLLDSGEGWFREPILEGHPLARVTDENAYRKGLEDAFSHIGRLAADTLSYEDSQTYVSGLRERIAGLLEHACERKHIAGAEATKRLTVLALEWVGTETVQIPLCMSHGDFQSGNIWVDNNGKTWLYDWETAGRRSIWYDSAVLHYSLRRAHGWQSLLEEARPEGICHCDPDKNRTPQSYQSIKGILLLEDILFYLEDMLELPEDWGKEIYDAFVQRMEKVLL